MKSLSIFSQSNFAYRPHGGFTLMEVLLVMAILAVVAGSSVVLGLDSYRAYSFRGDRDMVVAILQKARSQAINNVCTGGSCTGGKAHGVHFQSGHSVIFQGPDYMSRDIWIDEFLEIQSGTVTITGPDIIFTQLSGDATPAGASITVADETGKSSVISINSEGQITWTN